MMLVYQDVLFTEEIVIRSMRKDVAQQLHLYPCTNEAEPRSKMFVIDSHQLLTSSLSNYKVSV